MHTRPKPGFFISSSQAEKMSDLTDTVVFRCQMCGHCCEGSGGIIVSPADLDRLSAFLRQTPDRVRKRYLEKLAGKWRLKSEKGKCVFFEAGIGCSVHHGKPAVCRAWPFFRGNLLDPSSLDLARDYCPGIGRNVSHDDFVRFGRKYLQEEGLLARDHSIEANALVPIDSVD